MPGHCYLSWAVLYELHSTSTLKKKRRVINLFYWNNVLFCVFCHTVLYWWTNHVNEIGKNNKSKQQNCTFAGVGFYWSTLTVQFECQCASSPGWDFEAVGLWIWFWAAEFGPQTAWRDHKLWGWQRQGIQCVSSCNTETTTQVQPNLTCVASLKLHDVAGWREIASEVLKMYSI